MPRGRPRKNKDALNRMKEAFFPEEEVVVQPKVEYVKREDNRVDKSKVPLKFDPNRIELSKACLRLYPKTIELEMSALIRTIDWFEKIMDSDVTGWRQKYTIAEVVQKLEDEEDG